MTITNDLLFQKAVKAMKFAALGIKNVSTCKTKKKKKKKALHSRLTEQIYESLILF